MNHKIVHKIIGLIVFLFVVTVLFLTVQPTVSLWDCGELSAASVLLQNTHPPGAPLFILLNRIFTLVPFAANIGFRVNTLTVIASAFSVLFLYLTAVRLMNNFRYKSKGEQTPVDFILTYLCAAVGALMLGFADTFWFNATESNVFGFSTFLYTLMVWVLMVWWDKSEEKGSEKYLFFVAYVIGLSPGVHLMSVLAAVPLGMLFVMKKFTLEESAIKESAKILSINITVLITVAFVLWGKETSAEPPSPEQFKSYDTMFKLVLLAITLGFMFIFRKKVIHKNSLYWPFLIGVAINFVVYPGVVKYIPHFITHLVGDDLIVNSATYILFIGVIAYSVYYTRRKKLPIWNFALTCLLLTIFGVTVYTMVLIRANSQVAMNEDEPKNFPKLVSYLGREQYGDFPTWKRRYSPEPQHRVIWSGEYSSDLDYLLRWQLHHQYNRYLSWNFIGRTSWIQDSGIDFTKFFGIPFFLGLFGLYYHFRRDWKLATVFLAMFIFMGYFICFYQDQQQAQPRERDYFYAGSFFVFAIWTALGLRGLIDIAREKFKGGKTAIAYGLVGVVFLAGPINMLRTNYHDHDRSKNWIPWDYAYNILQSCEKDAVLFTCGDNDTFPLWYIQDVEGVRRDVRIVNLSLVNSDWYPKQMKNHRPYGDVTVPITFNYTNDQLSKLTPTEWKPRYVDVPVQENVYKQFGIKDSSITKQGKISFFMNSTIGEGKVKGVRVQDLLVKDIIEANKWQRPIYFSITCDPSNRIGTDEYLQLEGLAMRLVPFKPAGNIKLDYEPVNVELTSKALLGENVTPSKTPQRGSIIRNFNDKSIFLEEVQMKMIPFSYRSAYLSLANYSLKATGDNLLCIKALDKLEENFPHDRVDVDFRMYYSIALMYLDAGDREKFEKFAKISEENANDALKNSTRKYEVQAAQYVLGKFKEVRDSLALRK